MEEESAQRGGTEGGSKLPSTAPAFFVILTPSQGDGSKEEGILVANKGVSSVAPVITTGPNKSKSDFFLSSNCTSGEITVTLDNNNMWNEFYRCNTEMVLTKQGRRMFPYCRYWISGLNPYLKYILVMDITPLDNQRYKWNGKWWEPAGKADPHVLGRVFIHPESPSTGQYWMHQPVSFYKLKLTNNILDQEGHIILHSMHRYLPRLHVVPAEKASEVIQLNGPDVHTFTFPQTEFIAVTAYQNFQITQLKIDCNPFAKGFREGTVPGRPIKDLKHKPSEQEADASGSKSVDENEDSDRKKKLQELFKMSEYLDGDKENDIFNSVRDFLKSTSVVDTKPSEDVLKRFNEHSSVASLSKPTEQLSVEVKKEPEDNYDYSKTAAIEGVAVKQEQSDAEVADDYSNSEVDYPILEKHFAKFKEDPYLDGNHSSDSPTGVAKAKFLELDQGSMCLEPCAADKNNLEAPDLQKPVSSEDTLQDMDVQDSTFRTESPPIFPSPSVTSQVGVDVSGKEKRNRVCKNKIDEIYATLQTALKTSRGPKRKCPLLFPKPPVTPTPGNEGTVAPIAKKRGRPPKPKISKVGRPAKKDNPIEAPRLFPDFNPDIEDVDGVLFVSFSSKDALDVHMGKKPPDNESSSFLTPEAKTELSDEMQKILRLESQLLTHLKTMKYRQVIHPALQQVGLKLNIVDPTMCIDLRYLGVELPLLSITSDTNYDDKGLCAKASGWPFVSRTGKTTDYTKIKGWRDKFSTDSATSSHKNEAGRKNLSAFCSDELDEYLENEAKLMGDQELTWREPESSVSYQLPTKSSSYVRTLDSVLKKQAQQAASSLNAREQFAVPRKKRKYTRRVPTPKSDSKLKPILPPPITVKEKSTKPHSVHKKDHSASHAPNKVTSTPSSSVDYLSKAQPVLKPSEDEQSGTVQHNLVTAGEDNVFLNLQTQQISKPIGFSKAQMKLLELEECAVWEGKPRTYITKERADLSLSTLLTAQASLRNKPIQKLINRQTNSCNKDFCRLGCICSSLSLAKHTATHCRHETCMLSSDCLQDKTCEKDRLKDETTQEESERDFSADPGYGYQPAQAEHTVDSLEVKLKEEPQEMAVDDAVKAKKRKFNEDNDRKSDVRTPVRFPMWNRSDVADDPEPLCIPEQAEFVEPKILHKEHAVKGKSPGGGKAGRPSTVARVPPEDPVYLYFNRMMTCARVRVYQRKAPEEKKMKDQSIRGSDTPVKEHDLKSSKAREQEKDANKEDEIVEKKCETNNNSPTKLIEIISDCTGEEDDSKVLNITAQGVTSREPQSFKLGSFNIEQMQGNGEKSTSGTFCSRVKIEVSAEKRLNSAPSKPRPVKLKAEKAKPSEEPKDPPADIEVKSHGGKGLPFYTKVIPAGKLVARLKTLDVNQAELVEVNGKNHPQAKLLLGQMGALHPANRLAAYVTHRLLPNRSHLSKLNESAKMATKSPSDWTTEDKSKDISPSQQNKTAAQSRPSSTLTLVLGDDGSVQKSPGTSSSEPTILGSPKLSIQSTRLLFVSSTVAAGKQAPAITTTSSSSMNLPSLSTIPLSSAGLSTVSPSTKKAISSLPTLMRVTKLITKGSSLSIPAGIVATTDARAMTLTSVPSTKDTVLTPPILSPSLVKSLPTAGNRSSISPSKNPGTNKSIATSLPTLVVSPNISRLGSVASQVGLNIASKVTVKTVSTSTVPALNPARVTSGFGKRLGPRLLLIPVNSASAPARPVQCTQSSPGQKMVLQPIKTTSGVTLFRHPNGQIIQLVPLQQVQSSNIQPSRQQVVIRSPGPVMGVRLPLLKKSEASATTSVSIPATTIPPASASSNLPVVSPSKTSPNKSGTAIFPQNPPMLSQLGRLAVKASPSKGNCEASLSFPKVVGYTGSGHTVITSKVMPLLSGGPSLANVPPPPLQNNSPANAAANPNITLMGNKPSTASDPNKQDKKPSDSSSPLPCDSSVEKNDKEAVEECEGQPTSEIISDENGAEVQKTTNQQIKSVIQEVKTFAEEEQCQNGQQDNEQHQPSIASVNELFASDVDLLQEASKEDAQGVLMMRDQGPADNGDSQQSVADENTNSQAQIGDSSPVNLASAENVAAGVEQNILDKTGEKAELSIEQISVKQQDSVSSNQNNCESLQVEPHSKHAISDNQEIQSNLPTEDESEVDSVDIESVEELSDKISLPDVNASATTVTLNEDKCGTQGEFSKDCKKGSKSEVDEYVDVETVEALSEKINLAHLKESAATKDNCGTEEKSSKGRQKDSKMTGEDIFSVVGDEDSNVFQRKNHTANERKRRSEMRDLFEELRNALGLHNLPKVSKSFILKQAIEEVEDLTDAADTLIKKKTLLSQTQAQLIKKVSNLSGKTKEVVLKKLEYLYAKQKAVEAEQQMKNLEEDVALYKASMTLPPPKREPFLPLKLEEETNETLSSKTKKPIILARKTLLLPKEGNQLQPGVSLTTSNVLMAPTGQVGKPEHSVAGLVAGIPPTLIQADLSPAQIKSGMTSLVIQLPSAIKLKGIIANNPVPISLSTVPSSISTATHFGPASDKDDLSMMPKIVNVTSLAQGAESDMGKEFEIGNSGTETEWKSDAPSLTSESCAKGNAPVQDASYVTTESWVPSTSVPVDKMKEGLADPARESCSSHSSLHENLPQENDSSNTEASLKTKNVSMSNAPLTEMVDDIRDSGLDLELKKLTSAIEEAGLDPTELSDTMGDPEDADETLTTLLNEIAFLNQPLNNDADALESVSDFPGPGSSVSKFADMDSSPFSFGKFKDVPETKEKNVSFSPLFMQLEEGEILDTSRHNEGAGTVVFGGGARKETPLTDVVGMESGHHQPLATASTHQETDQSVSSCSDVFWRPMPKLAPLGLKSHTMPDDQSVLASKPMPSLASVAMILSSPKTTD